MDAENYTLPGVLLGINGQIPGGFLGLNRNLHLLDPNNFQSAVPLMDINSSSQGSTSTTTTVGVKDCSLGLGSQNLFRPIPLRMNVNSSDEDDPSFDAEFVAGSGTMSSRKEKEGPWQRMKWTDKIVRLLIQVVSSVGEDGSVDGDSENGTPRLKSGIFKKGKWKTVSSILISKGYQASPQQCEDKFNDLNKRYKKLNDVLGRGVSCEVVANPELLEKMSHISPKDKKEVKKLLSSKHLFYKEMCAYHNGLQITPLHCGLESHNPHKNYSDAVNGGSPTGRQVIKYKDVSEDDEENSDDDDASEDDTSDEEGVNGDDARNGKVPFKSRLEDLHFAMAMNFNDAKKSKHEQKEWVRKRMLELEEERIEIQAEALELRKRRVKWQRFCAKKESELEMAKLENERMMLDYESKALQLRKTQAEER